MRKEGERSRNFLEKVSRALQKLSKNNSRVKALARRTNQRWAPAARRHHILLALTHFASGDLKTFREKFLRISKAFKRLRGLKRSLSAQRGGKRRACTAGNSEVFAAIAARGPHRRAVARNDIRAVRE